MNLTKNTRVRNQKIMHPGIFSFISSVILLYSLFYSFIGYFPDIPRPQEEDPIRLILYSA